MGGLPVMLTIAWRGSRRQILGWTVGLVALFAGTAWSLHSLYPNPAKLATYARATETGTSLYAVNGRPYGLHSLGGVIVYEFGFIAALAFPLMGTHLINRLTRREEQSGRMELLRGGTVGRAAPVLASLAVTAIANLAVGLSMAVVLVALGLGWPGDVLYPLSVTLLGMTFAAVAALAAQVVRRSRLVTTIGLGVLAVAALARGVGDVRNDALVWLSPIGWAEQTRPFGAARWWPAALTACLVVVVSGVAVALATRRDFGAGLFPSRPGPSRAAQLLLHQLGFTARQHRAAVLGWSLVAALVGGSFGALADSMRTALQGNASLQRVIAGGSSNIDAYTSFVMLLLVLLCLAFGIQGLGRMAEEEQDSRLETTLSGTVTRSRWLAGHGVALVVGVVVVALVGGLGLGVSEAVVVGDPQAVARLALATCAYLPGVLALLGLWVVLYGLRADLLAWGWAVFVVVSVIAILGDTLRLPQALRDVSPLSWVGRVPLGSANPWALGGSLTLAAVFAGLALAAFSRRDIGSAAPEASRMRYRVVRQRIALVGGDTRHGRDLVRVGGKEADQGGSGHKDRACEDGP